jgi:hypothetical protein
MKPVSSIELPVRCRIVRARRLTPLHWSLLRALEVFPAGNRLSFEDFAARISLSDSAFLKAAWEELLASHAIDNANFQESSLTIEGQDALRQGYLPQGQPEEQLRYLHLDQHGQPLVFRPRPATPAQTTVSAANAVPSPRSPETQLPWKASLTPELLASHLRSPACSSPLSETEALHSAHPLWSEARPLA